MAVIVLTPTENESKQTRPNQVYATMHFVTLHYNNNIIGPACRQLETRLPIYVLSCLPKRCYKQDDARIEQCDVK